MRSTTNLWIGITCFLLGVVATVLVVSRTPAEQPRRRHSRDTNRDERSGR